MADEGYLSYNAPTPPDLSRNAWASQVHDYGNNLENRFNATFKALFRNGQSYKQWYNLESQKYANALAAYQNDYNNALNTRARAEQAGYNGNLLAGSGSAAGGDSVSPAQVQSMEPGAADTIIPLISQLLGISMNVESLKSQQLKNKILSNEAMFSGKYFLGRAQGQENKAELQGLQSSLLGLQLAGQNEDGTPYDPQLASYSSSFAWQALKLQNEGMKFSNTLRDLEGQNKEWVINHLVDLYLNPTQANYNKVIQEAQIMAKENKWFTFKTVVGALNTGIRLIGTFL